MTPPFVPAPQQPNLLRVESRGGNWKRARWRFTEQDLVPRAEAAEQERLHKFGANRAHHPPAPYVVVPVSGGLHSLAAFYRAGKESRRSAAKPVAVVVIDPACRANEGFARAVSSALDTCADEWGNLGYERDSASWLLAIVEVAPGRLEHEHGVGPEGFLAPGAAQTVAAICGFVANAIHASAVVWGIPADHPTRAAIAASPGAVFPFPSYQGVSSWLEAWLTASPDPQRRSSALPGRSPPVILSDPCFDDEGEGYEEVLDAVRSCPLGPEHLARLPGGLAGTCAALWCGPCRRTELLCLAATDGVLPRGITSPPEPTADEPSEEQAEASQRWRDFVNNRFAPPSQEERMMPPPEGFGTDNGGGMRDLGDEAEEEIDEHDRNPRGDGDDLRGGRKRRC